MQADKEQPQINQVQQQQAPCTLIIMRGVPGSGKSTKAKKLAGQNGLIFSTDDFFMKNGQYVFDPKMIGQYHEKNQKRTQQALQMFKPLIIVDNTNVKLWEMKRYVQLADKYNYKVKIEQSQTEWAKDYKQCGKNNTHGVPADKIKIMIQNYEQCNSLDDIRNSSQGNRNKGNNNKGYYKKK